MIPDPSYTPRRFLIMGAPGSGKGTQSALLASHFRIPAISTGDMFRAELAANSPFGIRVRQFVHAGEFVPDSLTNEIVEDRLGRLDCADGSLLDGYPRTVAQVHHLDGFLARSGSYIDAVILLESDHQTLIDRLEHRSSQDGRSDDRIDVIRHRIELFDAETAPVAEIYGERGMLVRVDANGTPEGVFSEIIRELTLLSDAVGRNVA